MRCHSESVDSSRPYPSTGFTAHLCVRLQFKFEDNQISCVISYNTIMDMMNSAAAAAAYGSHSYYRGDPLSTAAAGHAATVAANCWSNLTPNGKYSLSCVQVFLFLHFGCEPCCSLSVK